jgi:hypothetical protein
MIRLALRRLLCRPGTRELLAQTLVQLARMENTMATQENVNELAGRVNAVKTTVDTGVGNIRSDIETLKAQRPELDFSALEGSVAALETSVQGVTELDAENPAAEVPAEPTPAEPVDPQA